MEMPKKLLKWFEAFFEERTHPAFRSRKSRENFHLRGQGGTMAQTRGAKRGKSTYRILGRRAVPVENYSPKVSRHVISESTEAQGRLFLEESW